MDIVPHYYSSHRNLLVMIVSTKNVMFVNISLSINS